MLPQYWSRDAPRGKSLFTPGRQVGKSQVGDLRRLDKKDTVGFKHWRERLEYELHVNGSGILFPDKKVLGYYTTTAVDSPTQVAPLRDEIKWTSRSDPTQSQQLPSNRHLRGVLLDQTQTLEGHARVNATPQFIGALREMMER
ncbi:MAG: hypothetical protein Q9218_006247 [Villophora microphyllina]